MGEVADIQRERERERERERTEATITDWIH